VSIGILNASGASPDIEIDRVVREAATQGRPIMVEERPQRETVE
jgi:hypothetical protein